MAENGCRGLWQFKMPLSRPLALLKVSWKAEEGFRGLSQYKMPF